MSPSVTMNMNIIKRENEKTRIYQAWSSEKRMGSLKQGPRSRVWLTSNPAIALSVDVVAVQSDTTTNPTREPVNQLWASIWLASWSLTSLEAKLPLQQVVQSLVILTSISPVDHICNRDEIEPWSIAVASERGKRHTVAAHYARNTSHHTPQERMSIDLMFSPVVDIRGFHHALVFLFTETRARFSSHRPWTYERYAERTCWYNVSRRLVCRVYLACQCSCSSSSRTFPQTASPR